MGKNALNDKYDVRKISENKKRYLSLLLLADEQENMVDTYLERGEMFVLDDDGAKAECVVTKEADHIYEIKNIAVLPRYQRRGYGEYLVDFVLSYYPDCKTMVVGTGDVPSTIGFYKRRGFVESHCVKDFFVDNYDHPIFEDGKQLVDMVYLRREIRNI